ncbi:MAG: glycosyltransferase family 4 protein [Chloroflexota bacterium]|jgi:glycosyltransferase involved in cell wall biosynthesis
MRLTYLLLSPTFGMHQYTADLANRMADHFDVSLVTVDSCPRDRYSPAVAMQTPVALSNTGLSPEGLRLGHLARVKQALVETRADVVHITGPHLWNLALVRWLGRQGIPVIHTIHDLDPHHGTSYGRLLHLWNWAIIRWVDHLLVHGEKYRQRVIAAGRRPDEVTSTPLTHLFVGYEMGRRLAAQDVEAVYEPMILFFGRQEQYKGVDILLAAYERLKGRLGRAQPGPDLRLVLAGPGGAYKDRFADVLPDVEWRNHLIGDEEGVDLFRRCAVVALPYRDATQSAVVAAAYFFQKPVIVTDVGALAEYVEPGKTGLVVQGEDMVEAITDALSYVLTTPDQRIMGLAGRAWYDDRRARETRQLTVLYQRMAELNKSLRTR